MVDIVDSLTRSRMMSGIRGKNTKPEILLRKALFRRGFRYKLHAQALPGKPDLVLSKYKAVIMVHGCFWHGHQCHLFKWPSSNVDFWRQKILDNVKRDKKCVSALQAAGWKVGIVWECALKGKRKKDLAAMVEGLCVWLQQTRHSDLEISGR
jgi:DNA mismatch endonuclease (patch repair protein)